MAIENLDEAGRWEAECHRVSVYVDKNGSLWIEAHSYGGDRKLRFDWGAVWETSSHVPERDEYRAGFVDGFRTGKEMR